MSESHDAMISFLVPTSFNLEPPKKPAGQTPLPSNRPRAAMIAVFVLGLSLVGLGTWRFFGSARTIDDGESIVDIDGFETESSLTGDSAKLDASGSSSLGVPQPMQTDDETPITSASRNLRFKNETQTTSKVWLTGTIEESEPIEQIPLPERLSGGPSDTSVLR